MIKIFIPLLFFSFKGAKDVGTSFTSLSLSSKSYLFFPYENERPYFLFGFSNFEGENELLITGGVNPDTLFSLKFLYSVSSEKKENIGLLGGFGNKNLVLFLGGDMASQDSFTTGFMFKAGIETRFHYMGSLNKFVISGGGVSSLEETPFLNLLYSLKFAPLKYVEPVLNSRFQIEERLNYKFGLSSELIIYKNYEFFVGFMKEKDVSPYFSLGLGYFTSNFEKNDFGIHYGFISNGEEQIHSVSLSVFIGDNLRFEKERIKREKKLKEIAEREKLVEENIKKIKEKEKEIAERERKILEEKGEIAEEREKLEWERKEIEKLRKEAYETLKKIEGIKIEERKEYIKITAEEKAIYFEIGGAGLNIKGIKTLKAIANFIKTYPGYKVRVEGHTDNIPIGPLLKDKYRDNTELSQARAKTVVDYFVEIQDLPEKIFTYKGYGEKRPVASNDTEEGRAKNRRVEIYIEKKG